MAASASQQIHFASDYGKAPTKTDKAVERVDRFMRVRQWTLEFRTTFSGRLTEVGASDLFGNRVPLGCDTHEDVWVIHKMASIPAADLQTILEDAGLIAERKARPSKHQLSLNL